MAVHQHPDLVRFSFRLSRCNTSRLWSALGLALSLPYRIGRYDYVVKLTETMIMATHTKVASPRNYGAPAGIRLVAAIESVGFPLFNAVQAANEAATLGLTKGHTNMLLHELAAGGWITRVKKGLYAVNDPLTRSPKAHPFSIGAAIVERAAISHWSAFQHWGLTEQIPSTVMLSSPTRTFPPAAEDHAASGRPGWTVAGVRYEFVSVPPPRFFGVTEVWLDEQSRVPVFERERALLDAFYHFHIFGSLSVGMEILEAHLSDIDVDRLVDYAVRFGVAAIVKRLGWVLDHLGTPRDVLQPLLAYPAKGNSPLDPGLPARGRHDATWHVIENLTRDR